MDFYMPVQVHTGSGSVKAGQKVFARFGKSCLIVTSRSAARVSGALDDVTQALDAQGVKYVVYDRCAPNPTLVSCMEAGKLGSENGAEFVIGIGGGSPLDAAKAAAVFAANPALDESAFYDKAWPARPLPILLVGTTAGTGSEVTDVAVLTDSKQRKHSIHDPALFAFAAFGDPHYAAAMPHAVALSTGIDAFAHCAESYFSKKATDISRGNALQGIRLLLPPLRRLTAGGTLSESDYGALYDGSILGGLAICTTGTCFPHNMGYFLTERFGMPHGFACASFLCGFFRFVAAQDAAYMDGFLNALGVRMEDLLTLIAAALPENTMRLTKDEMESVLPRWENNGSVKNTLGDFSMADVRRALADIVKAEN